MRGHQHNRQLRLKAANACDHLKPCDVGKEQIDDAEPKTPAARVVESIMAIGRKHDLIAMRLEAKLERITYRRFIVNDQNGELLVCFSTNHDVYTS